MRSFLTVGHGTRSIDEFIFLLNKNNVDVLIDVRSFPGSRLSPHFGRENMCRWLPSAGISYEWMQELGGFRKPTKESENLGLRHKSFRAYGDYMGTDEFDRGMKYLLSLTKDYRVAIMCSESCWWRCHRRLISDAGSMLYGAKVRHIMEKGKMIDHKPTDTATVQGCMKYPLGGSDLFKFMEGHNG